MHGSEERRRSKGAGLAPWQLERATQLLLSAVPADHFVAKLADACGLSPSYFSRAFKVSTGESPHRWLMRRRVQRASEMLAHSNERISQIALNCGFSDQSHLTRIFHAIVGSSPADWRRRRRSGVLAGTEPNPAQ